MKITTQPEVLLLLTGVVSVWLSNDKYLAAGIMVISLSFYIALVRIGVGIRTIITKLGDLSSLQNFLKQLTGGK